MARFRSNGRTRAWTETGARQTRWPWFAATTSLPPASRSTPRSRRGKAMSKQKQVGFVTMGAASGGKKINDIGVGMLGYAFMGKAHSTDAQAGGDLRPR